MPPRHQFTRENATRGRVKVRKPRPRTGPISWDDAICYAEEQIAQAKRRIAVLEGTVHVFRDRKQQGDAFPGASVSPGGDRP